MKKIATNNRTGEIREYEVGGYFPMDIENGDIVTLENQEQRDIHASPFYEAICPHGVGHHKGVHGCDGCCETAPKEIWDKVTVEEELTNN